MSDVYRLQFVTPENVPYATNHEADDLDMAVAHAIHEWSPVRGYTLVAAQIENDDFTWSDLKVA